MSPTVDFNKICDYLEADDNILFALVFGSAAGGKTTALSDVDVGIYTYTRKMKFLSLKWEGLLWGWRK